MSVKRFTAPDMRRALDLVRREMGPDAIILSSQRTKNGIEIVTSDELDQPGRGMDTRKAFGNNFDEENDQPLASDHAWQAQQGVDKVASKFKNIAITGANRDDANRLAADIEQARQRMIAAKKAEQDQPAPSKSLETAMEKFEAKLQQNRQTREFEKAVKQREDMRASQHEEHESGRLTELQNEIADMRLLLEEQMWRMTQNNGKFEGQSMSSNPASGRLQTQLNRLGLPSNIVSELTAAAQPGERLNVTWRNALARLSKNIPIDTTDRVAKGGVFAFVGSTGVGKTTTIAKLAARYVLDNGMGKVAIIATDSYRVGAHDQLKALGRILGVPVRIVDQERKLPSVLDGLKNYPLVLIDTAGFRHGDENLKAQDAMLDACPSIERILVLATNSQLPSLKASIHAHRKGRIAGCVLTKLDETASLGEAIGLVIQQNLPITYTSDGQEIPHDLHVASGSGMIAKAVALAKESNAVSGQVFGQV